MCKCKGRRLSLRYRCRAHSKDACRNCEVGRNDNNSIGKLCTSLGLSNSRNASECCGTISRSPTIAGRRHLRTGARNTSRRSSTAIRSSKSSAYAHPTSHRRSVDASDGWLGTSGQIHGLFEFLSRCFYHPHGRARLRLGNPAAPKPKSIGLWRVAERVPEATSCLLPR